MLPQRSSSLNLSHFQQALSLLQLFPCLLFVPISCRPTPCPSHSSAPQTPCRGLHTPATLRICKVYKKKSKSALKPRLLSKVLDTLSKQNTPLKDINPLESVRSDPDAY